MLTEYEEKMFNNLNTLTEVNKWYGIKQDRSDLEAFINVIKKRIDLNNDFEFSNDYTMFKRVLPFSSMIHDHNVKHDFMPQINEIHLQQIKELNIKFPSQWKR